MGAALHLAHVHQPPPGPEWHRRWCSTLEPLRIGDYKRER